MTDTLITKYLAAHDRFTTADWTTPLYGRVSEAVTGTYDVKRGGTFQAKGLSFNVRANDKGGKVKLYDPHIIVSGIADYRYAGTIRVDNAARVEVTMTNAWMSANGWTDTAFVDFPIGYRSNVAAAVTEVVRREIPGAAYWRMVASESYRQQQFAAVLAGVREAEHAVDGMLSVLDQEVSLENWL